MDFDDEKFGGYTVDDFDRLVRECRFLDIVERPNCFRARSAGRFSLAVGRSKQPPYKKSDLERNLPDLKYLPFS